MQPYSPGTNHSDEAAADEALMRAALAAQGARQARQAPGPKPIDPYAPIDPRAFIEATFREALSAFAPVKQTTSWGKSAEDQGLPRCQAALSLLEGAITRLGDGKSARENAARTWLEAHRSAIASAVNAFQGFGADCSGPVAIELIDRFAAVREARASAEFALAEATPETLADAQRGRDLVALDERDLQRSIDQALASLRFPAPLPNAQHFELAERDCIDLESKPGRRPKCRDVHAAIEAGMRRELEVARLWPVYETQPEHELVKWRGRAFEER